MKRQFLAAENYCSSVRDGTHDTPAPTVSGFKLVTGKHIKNGIIDPSDAYYISEDDFNSINKRSLVEKWDVLMSMIGTIGEVAVVTETPLYAIKNVALFKCDGSEIRGKWLAYYLRSGEAKGHMRGNMKGSSQQFLSLKQLRSLPIPIAAESEMKKIVDVLSAYDDLIENNRKQIKLLEEAAQRLYKEWFIDLRFPGHETTPIVDGIPSGWTLKTFSDVFTYERGKSYSSSEIDNCAEVLLINLKNIKAWGGYNRNAEKHFSGIFKSEQMLHRNDIVMAVTDMTQERRLVGHVALIPQLDMPAIFSMDLIRIIPKSLSTLFLYSVLAFGEYGAKISLLANGTNVLHLKPDAMMSKKILIPTNNLVEKYEKLFSAIRDKIEYLEMQNSKNKEVRDRLLPKLMNGELEVD